MFLIPSKYGRIDPLMREYILQSTNESMKKKMEYLNKNKYSDFLTFNKNIHHNFGLNTITKNYKINPINCFSFYWLYLFLFNYKNK
jgi:hypothetical protein